MVGAPAPWGFDTHPRWLPETQCARSRRPHGKIGDCEQPTLQLDMNITQNTELLAGDGLRVDKVVYQTRVTVFHRTQITEK